MVKIYTLSCLKNRFNKAIFYLLIVFSYSIQSGYATELMRITDGNIPFSQEVLPKQNPISIEQFQNPPLSEEWLQAAEIAAKSWDMEVDEYIDAIKKQIEEFNQNHKDKKPVVLQEVIPASKAITFGGQKKKENKKGPYCYIPMD